MLGYLFFLTLAISIDPDFKRCKAEEWVQFTVSSFLFFSSTKKGRVIDGNGFGCKIQYAYGNEFETKLYSWKELTSMSTLDRSESRALRSRLDAWYDNGGPKRAAMRARMRQESNRPRFSVGVGFGNGYNPMPRHHGMMNPATGLPYRMGPPMGGNGWRTNFGLGFKF